LDIEDQWVCFYSNRYD